jgi:hypothetical protein
MYKSSNSLWFSWALVTSIASTIGFPLGVFIGDYFFPDQYYVEQKILSLLTVIVISGLVIGFGQWTIIRTKLKRSWMWIPATAIGLPLGFFIGFFVKDFLIKYVFEWALPFIMPIVGGVFIGMLQCLALSRKLNASFKWILVSGLSWGIVLNQVLNNFFGAFIVNSYIQNTYLQLLVYGFLIGITIGTISGVFIESIFINPKPESKVSA